MTKWMGKRHELVDCTIDIMKREEGSIYPHITKDKDWKPPDGSQMGRLRERCLCGLGIRKARCCRRGVRRGGMGDV
jgi:hypothetical protein